MEAFKMHMLITLSFFLIIWLGFNKTWFNSLAIAAACSLLYAYTLNQTLEISRLTQSKVNIYNNHYHIGEKEDVSNSDD